MQSHRTTTPGPRARRRRWRVPPALLHGPEALEGGSVLQEVGGSLGLVLWQALGDVVLWAETPPPERVGLFAVDAERRRLAALMCLSVEAALEDALRELACLTGRPERVRAERVALACWELAQWAEREHKAATALALAQGAALACPGDAAAAFKVGQLARKQAQYARAESWLRRTVALARQSGDWISYSLAFSGLGTMYAQRGNFPMARKFHTRALRAAKRHCLHDIAGGALHDLFVVAVTSDRADEAERYAQAALEEYGPANPKLPRLAHDVGYFWMERGYFARALPVFQALLAHMIHPGERIAAVSNIARAAGGANDTVAFEHAWEASWEMMNAQQAEGHAEALLELARGAASRKDWDRAEIAAKHAITVARERDEARIEIAAESVVEAIQSSRRAGKQLIPGGNPALAVDVEGDALAAKFVRRLREYAVPS